MRIILASASPRRQQLLRNIVKDFVTVTSNADESLVMNTPEDNVMNIAKNKALSVARAKDDLVIGSDTTVYMDGAYYNKPADEEDARRMLRELSGRVHTVYTGVCIVYKDMVRCFYDKTAVKFNELDDKFIEEYVASGSPMDKAGAYGIQDGNIIESYEGDYTAIMGLPVKKLRTALREILNNGSENSY